MRTIHLANMEKTRPVLILTRDWVRTRLSTVTIAPITSTIRGLLVEVPVGPANGLDHDSVINCDNITTIPVTDLGRQIGFLLPVQEAEITAAIRTAFELI